MDAIREQLADERMDQALESSERFRMVSARLSRIASQRLRRVINGTGVVLHTNLGRAPLAGAAVDALAVSAGYSNLELDLETGRRGERGGHVTELIRQLFTCDAALVVNNNAAAVLLALTALCKGKEVIVSRGQLVEIGGSFRMPDVMRLSGARMVEVGTTNRTRTADYETAVTAKTAALLRVHTSNFRVTGFTESTSLDDLAHVAREHGLLVIDDLGSGAAEPFADEPTIAESVAHCDVVTFSGDKLLGGPQSGIVVGRGEAGIAAVKKMSRHPLARALRIDKLTLAALEATLRLRLMGKQQEIPVARMLAQSREDLRRRVAMWSVKLADREVPNALIDGHSEVGGGAVPEHALASTLLAIEGPASRLSAALRHGEPPVIARIENGRCCIDPRTVMRGEDEVLIDALEAAVKGLRG